MFRPLSPSFALCLVAGALWLPDSLLASTSQPEPPNPSGEPPTQPLIPPGPGEPPPPTPEELITPRPVTFRIQTRGELSMNADFRDDAGDVTVNRVGAAFGVAIPVRQYAQLDVGLDYEFSHYAFSDALGFGIGAESPWERIHRETLSIRFSQQLALRTSAFIGGTAGFAHEEGAELSDSFTMAGFGGLRYAVTERAFVTLGLGISTRLEDSPRVFPLPGLDWRISNEVRLTTGGRLGLTLEYTASEQVRFTLGAAYEEREFRLRDNGPVPGGVGRDRRIPITAGFGFTPTPQLVIEVSGGAHLAQQFRLRDEAGNTIADLDAKPTPFAGLQVSYRF